VRVVFGRGERLIGSLGGVSVFAWVAAESDADGSASAGGSKLVTGVILGVNGGPLWQA
jgi:hypothetical protein